jgi:hypothetical protein
MSYKVIEIDVIQWEVEDDSGIITARFFGRGAEQDARMYADLKNGGMAAANDVGSIRGLLNQSVKES